MKSHVILMISVLLLGFSSGFAQLVEPPTTKQMQEIEKLMAPHRKKVTDALNADKSGQYKTYLADLETIAKTEDSDTRDELLDKLTRDHYAFIKKAYNSAVVINHEEMRTGVARILGHNNFQLDEFGGISSGSFLPLNPISLRFDETRECPFTAADEASSQVILSVCDADAENCNVTVHSWSAYDGGCRSKASLGAKFELPEGDYHNITVSATSSFTYKGIALAFGGYAQANVKVGVRLQGPGYDKVVITKEDWCVAPVIWFTKFKANVQDGNLQAIFSGNFSGGNSFTAQAYNETFAMALPLLQAANAECRSFVNLIRFVAAN